VHSGFNEAFDTVADCVTTLPPGADTITILSWSVQFVPWVGKASRKFLLSKFSGYIHCGNMRFLTSVGKGAWYIGLMLPVHFWMARNTIVRTLHTWFGLAA
jgi:hypothetical protein